MDNLVEILFVDNNFKKEDIVTVKEINPIK